MDLGFGSCKLQVQVPVKGGFHSARDLVGRNIVTSFTALAGNFFGKLDQEKGDGSKTNIKYVGGSVEAACALGVADGIVDLVGMFFLFNPPLCTPILTSARIRRDNESCWPQGYRYSR